jgi:hypothetical protein
MKYILFKQIDTHDVIIDTLMESQFSQVNKITYKNNIIYTYDMTYVDDLNVLFEDLSGELLSDFLVYISPSIEEKTLYQHIDQLDAFVEKNVNLKRGVIHNQYLVSHQHLSNVTTMKKFILGKFHDQHYMLETIKTYLERNQNMMTASKELFIHRNTLMMRLEKFKDVTGFDVKTFYDGFLIYHLLI